MNVTLWKQMQAQDSVFQSQTHASGWRQGCVGVAYKGYPVIELQWCGTQGDGESHDAAE